MNKNVYYPTYTIDPQSIYGSGIVRTNKFPTTDTTTSVITDSFPINKKLSPPVYRSGVSVKPQDNNGYRVLENPDYQSYKLDNFYYTSQQANKNIIPVIKPTLKEKLAQKIKNVANNIVNDKKNNNKQINDNKYNNFKKKRNNHLLTNTNKKNLEFANDRNDSDADADSADDDFDSDINTQTAMNYIDSNIKLDNKASPVDKFGRNKKMWIDDHYLYSLEPRYNSVVYPWRANTWTYPIMPNTDNYYIDNINSTPPDPIIVSNDTTNKGNYQSIYLHSNMLKENFDSIESPNNSNYQKINEKYKQNKCVQNYNILYFIIIVLILSIYFNKE
jgi:hypothetical protein